MLELPSELLQNIVFQIEDMKCFYNLAKTCKQISEVTQDAIVQKYMKIKFGIKSLETTSKHYSEYKVATFTSYKYRKIYKFPKYHFSLEQTSTKEESNLTFLKVVEQMIRLDLPQTNNLTFKDIVWSYLDHTSATEVLWMVWGCLKKIRKQKNEIFEEAKHRAIHYLTYWISINSNYEWFSPLLPIDNLITNSTISSSSLLSSRSNNNDNISNNNNKGDNKERGEGDEIQTKKSAIKIEENGKLRVDDQHLFKSEYQRFIRWINDQNMKKIVEESYIKLISSYQSYQSFPFTEFIVPQLQIKEFEYNNSAFKLLSQLQDISPGGGVDMIVEQLQQSSLFIGLQITSMDILKFTKLNYNQVGNSILNDDITSPIYLLHNFSKQLITSIENFILFFDDDSDRSAAVKAWLEVVQRLTDSPNFPNYSVIQFILSALYSTALYRLKSVKNICSRSDHFTLNYNNGFSEYKAMISNLDSYFPILSFNVTNIMFIHERWEDDQEVVPKLSALSNQLQLSISPIRSSLLHIDSLCRFYRSDGSDNDYAFLKEFSQFSYLYTSQMELEKRSLLLQPRM